MPQFLKKEDRIACPLLLWSCSKREGDFLIAGSHNLHLLLANHITAYLQKENIPGQRRTLTIVLYERTVQALQEDYPLAHVKDIGRCAAQPFEQTGFRQGFCCVDHIQTVSRVIEICREYHLPLVLTFVDYEKALYSVETNGILSALVDQGVDSSYTGALTVMGTAPRKYNFSSNLLPYQ